MWRYGKCYDFGLLVCYTRDLRQFFGAKKPDRKWPEMTKNDLFPLLYVLEKFFRNFLLKTYFEIFFFIFLQMSNFFPNLSSFLENTECGSGISSYKFNFLTLYIPKKMSQLYLEWNIDVAFSKYQKNTTKQKFKISKKIEFLVWPQFQPL